MIDPNNKDNKDFLDFMNSKGVNPPEELSNRILNFVIPTFSVNTLTYGFERSNGPVFTASPLAQFTS